MLTVSWAKELADTSIKINAVTPGYTATDLNGNQGTRKVEDGAAVAVQMARPHGGFFSDGGIDDLEGTTVPW